jgi:ankyrin repeat protein
MFFQICFEHLYYQKLLHWAAIIDQIQIALLLIQNGAYVNAKTNQGFTPLLCASIDGHVDILHLLVEKGADLEAQEHYERRALHWAAILGHLPIIQELVSRYHVNINASIRAWTALGISRQENYPQVIAFLLEKNGCIE